MATVTELPNQELDDFIDSRLQRTSFHLKTIDFASGLIWLGLVVFGTLLAIVLVDHWVVGLGFWARIAALVGLIASALFVSIRYIALPMMRAINPEYAALAVEQSHPDFKNSLISFLFFRDRQNDLRPGVYDGIAKQTVGELNVVPIDSAVDRSQIIRLGYYPRRVGNHLGWLHLAFAQEPFSNNAARGPALARYCQTVSGRHPRCDTWQCGDL